LWPTTANAMTVAPDLTEEDLALTARAELALRAMIAQYRLEALTYQFMAFGEDERTQTAAVRGREPADGGRDWLRPAEGDLIAAGATTFFQLAAAAGKFLGDLHD